ncbi:MAG: lytic murein transglycosylase, partial [bacterium]
MLGKTPAVVALAAVFTMCAGVRPCTAQSASPAPPSVEAEQARFDAWRDRFRARALKAGIPHSVFKKALGNVQPDPTVHEKNEDQPEFARPVWEYLDGALSESRIANGRKMLRRHASLLADAERKWGVPRHFLVAIWGMETSYGALLGNHNIFEALATLSYRGGRAKYGEEQLLAALRLLADGHKPLEAMKGFWAGAVGHT